MTTPTFPFGFQPVYFTDANGFPSANANVYIYYTGTLNSAPTWSDADATAANPNPLQVDGSGHAFIWGNTEIAYDVVVQDANTGANLTTVNYGIGSGLLNGAVMITGDQTITGLKIFSGGAGFGTGNTFEYAGGIFDSVFGSSTELAGGLEIIANKTANISMANAVGVTDGGFGYNVVTKTLTVFARGEPVAIFTPNSVSFPDAATFSANGQAFLTGSSIVQISGGGTGQSDRASALLALAPPVSGNTGNALITDGSTIKWSSTAGVITLIDPPYAFFNGASQVNWTSFNVAAAGVSTTATKVLIQWSGSILGPGPSGTVLFYACARANTSQGNSPGHPEIDTFIIGAVDCQNNSNVQGTGGAGQAWVPLRAGLLFDFIVPTYSSKAWQNLTMKVVGYA
jgi:hypothetical protein